MDTHAWAVVRVVVRAKGRGGVPWAIVELGDGRLGISQDGQVLQTVQFHASEVEACVREFMRRSGMDDAREPRRAGAPR